MGRALIVAILCQMKLAALPMHPLRDKHNFEIKIEFVWNKTQGSFFFPRGSIFHQGRKKRRDNNFEQLFRYHEEVIGTNNTLTRYVSKHTFDL
jgi:hypothetical protein